MLARAIRPSCSDDQGYFLLKELGMPFRDKKMEA